MRNTATVPVAAAHSRVSCRLLPAGLLPAGFVELLDRLGTDVGHRFLMGRFQRDADFLFEIGDAAERDMDTEDVVSDLLDAALLTPWLPTR